MKNFCKISGKSKFFFNLNFYFIPDFKGFTQVSLNFVKIT